MASAIEKVILIFGREREEEQRMEAYEFYWLDLREGYKIIGVLPERRENTARITQQSIMNWVEKMFGKELDPKDIFFIQVTIDEKTGRMFRPIPYTVTQKEI